VLWGVNAGRNTAADRRVARLERIPEQPHEEFFVAWRAAVNVAIAMSGRCLWGAAWCQHLSELDSTKVSLLDRLAAVNLFLALFNMIPAFPMDGGRVLRALRRRASVSSVRRKLPHPSGQGLASHSDFWVYSGIRC